MKWKHAGGGIQSPNGWMCCSAPPKQHVLIETERNPSLLSELDHRCLRAHCPAFKEHRNGSTVFSDSDFAGFWGWIRPKGETSQSHTLSAPTRVLALRPFIHMQTAFSLKTELLQNPTQRMSRTPFQCWRIEKENSFVCFFTVRWCTLILCATLNCTSIVEAIFFFSCNSKSSQNTVAFNVAWTQTQEPMSSPLLNVCGYFWKEKYFK